MDYDTTIRELEAELAALDHKLQLLQAGLRSFYSRIWRLRGMRIDLCRQLCEARKSRGREAADRLEEKEC